MEDRNSPDAVAARANQEDPIIEYLIVRTSLHMTIGKFGAQMGHAPLMMHLKFQDLEKNESYRMMDMKLGDEQLTMDLHKRLDMYRTWLNTSYRKVTLAADEKEWAKLKAEIPADDIVIVVDAGLTEIPSGSETIMVVWPMPKSARPKCLKKLQSLKPSDLKWLLNEQTTV